MSNRLQHSRSLQLSNQLSKLLFISILYSNSIGAQIHTKFNEKYPKLLYAEGKKSGFITYGKPFIFLEIINDDSAFCYLGFYPYKGALFEGCFMVNLTKTNDTTFAGVYRPNSDKEQLNLLFNNNLNNPNISIEKYGLFNLRHGNKINEINVIRNKIYATSTYRLQEYEGKVSGIVTCLEPGVIYGNPIFQLPHAEFLKYIINCNAEKEWNSLFCY